MNKSHLPSDAAGKNTPRCFHTFYLPTSRRSDGSGSRFLRSDYPSGIFQTNCLFDVVSHARPRFGREISTTATTADVSNLTPQWDTTAHVPPRRPPVRSHKATSIQSHSLTDPDRQPSVPETVAQRLLRTVRFSLHRFSFNSAQPPSRCTHPHSFWTADLEIGVGGWKRKPRTTNTLGDFGNPALRRPVLGRSGENGSMGLEDYPLKMSNLAVRRCRG